MKKPTKIEWVPFLADKRENFCSDEEDQKKLAAELTLQLGTDTKYHDMYDGITTMSLGDARELLSQELQESANKRDTLASDLKKREKDLAKIRTRMARLRSLLR